MRFRRLSLLYVLGVVVLLIHRSVIITDILAAGTRGPGLVCTVLTDGFLAFKTLLFFIDKSTVLFEHNVQSHSQNRVSGNVFYIKKCIWDPSLWMWRVARDRCCSVKWVGGKIHYNIVNAS